MNRQTLKRNEFKAFKGIEYWLKQRKLALEGIGEHDLLVCDARIDELCQKVRDIKSDIYKASD